MEIKELGILSQIGSEPRPAGRKKARLGRREGAVAGHKAPAGDGRPPPQEIMPSMRGSQSEISGT
jgi:hypothetical protein